MSNKFIDALRARYKTPRDVLARLGLDQDVLESEMAKPTRIEALALITTAKAVNPLLALDAKIDYRPIFSGLTTKNLPQRKSEIVSRLKAATKGKTLAADASFEHVAKMLDHLEHNNPAEANLDESVSGPQHRAMEAAAHGHSNLGIPKDVGEEFSDADKGKKFGDDEGKEWLKGKGMSEDDIEKLIGGHHEHEHAADAGGESEADLDKDKWATDHEHAKDETEWESKETEKENEGKDEAEVDVAPKGKQAGTVDHGRKAKDSSVSMMGKAMKGNDKAIGRDELNATLKAALEANTKRVRENERGIRMALDEVRPYVGEIPSNISFDAADDVLRHALKMLGVDSAAKIRDADALRTILGYQTKAGAHPVVTRAANGGMAQDEAQTSDFYARYPEAKRLERF
jgi:hypothetical protein